MVELTIREAQEADLEAIVAIYNASIPAGWSTADTRPISVADRLAWFREFDPRRRPIWVAERQGAVIATTYLRSFYQGRPAYDATAEISVYVAPEQQRQGIGRRLKRWVISQCPRLGITTLLSCYFDHNEATRRLNDAFGFQTVGHLRDIAHVQGRSRGLVIAALRIPPASTLPSASGSGQELAPPERMVATPSAPGTVHLVGAGPGDPDLLTLRAHRLLRECDALVYDALVPTALLQLVRDDCELCFVGKRRGHHSVPQRSTNAALVELAGRHRNVVRLKGGDPFLFGRGGEEAAHLAAAGIPVQVVPGVTAGIAAPAYAGVPITHRAAGSSVTFVTGHEEIDKRRPGVDWRGLARSSDGLVIYMGLHNLRRIAEELQAGGLAADTPALVIQQGTVQGQRQLFSRLGGLADAVEAQGLAAPSIVVIGAVVAQRVPACAPPPARVEMPIPLAAGDG